MENQNKPSSNWLDKLQENSWNLELIISGFAIFGLFRLKDYLNVETAIIRANSSASEMYSILTNIFLGTIMVSVQIFIAFLILHVFLRGLWIGAIGLRYVSGAIEYDTLKYSPQFKDYLKRKVGSFDNYILRLETISSAIFSLTYLLVFIFGSVMLYFLEIMGLITAMMELLDKKSIIGTIITALILLLSISGIIVSIDFITLGLLKRIKNKWFHKIYLVIYRVVTTMSLAFLWRPLLYNFIDQKQSKWLVVIAFPALVLFNFLNNTQHADYTLFPSFRYSDDIKYDEIMFPEINRHSYNYMFYDDLRKEAILNEKQEQHSIRIMSLPSYKLRDAHMEVFVKYDQELEQTILQKDSTITAMNSSGLSLRNIHLSPYQKAHISRKDSVLAIYTKMKKTQPKAARELLTTFKRNEKIRLRKNLDQILSISKTLLQFSINDTPIDTALVHFNFIEHPNLKEKGFWVDFPLPNSIQQGSNILTLNKQVYLDKKQRIASEAIGIPNGKWNRYEFSIPFMYVSSQ